MGHNVRSGLAIAMRLVGPSKRPHPLILAIVATIGAAALVFYLQHRAITTLQSQTRVIVRQLSEQAAAGRRPRAAAHARRPGLRHAGGGQPPRPACRPPRPGGAPFQRGPRSLSRTSIGSSPGARRPARPPRTRRDVLWARAADSRRDPAMGRAVVALARQHAAVAADLHRRRERRRRPPPGLPAAVLGRRAAPGVLRGARLRHRSGQHARAAVRPAGAGSGFERDPVAAGRRRRRCSCSVTDEHGRRRLRRLAARRSRAARITFPMLFYPAEDIRSRLAAGVAPRPWIVEVGAPGLADVGRRAGPELLADGAVGAADAGRRSG